ncbi:MAG: glycosyltransferase [Candidatus Hydrogenedentota bacterium]
MEYEILWIEYYGRRPYELAEKSRCGEIDQWIVMNQSGMYFKHRMYNAGLLAAKGKYIVVCDSDAVFSPRFVETVLAFFEKNGDETVLYLEEIRSDNRAFYPFRGHSWDEIMSAPGLKNWDELAGKPKGLVSSHDPIHHRNYGACFCVSRDKAIHAGGFDEHEEYHCFLCGPYELGWRLVNKGFQEHWHETEWLLHTWHPWVKPEHEVMGRHDGRLINQLALESARIGRTMPWRANDSIRDQAEPVLDEPRENIDALLSRHTPRKQSGFWRSHAAAPLVERILVLQELDPYDALATTLRADGIAVRIENFYYDDHFHRFGQDAMEEQLRMLARYFLPDLILFRPTAVDFIARGEKGVEPGTECIAAIRAEIGCRLLLYDTTSERIETWRHHGSFVDKEWNSDWRGALLTYGFKPRASSTLKRFAYDASFTKPVAIWRARREEMRLVSLKRAAIFGAGPSGDACLATLKSRGIDVVCFLDNAEDRQGKLLRDLPIHPVSHLVQSPDIDGVVLSFQGGKILAMAQLANLGYTGAIINFDLLKTS